MSICRRHWVVTVSGIHVPIPWPVREPRHRSGRCAKCRALIVKTLQGFIEEGETLIRRMEAGRN